MENSLTRRAPSGLQHGLINTLPNSVKDSGFARFPEKDRPNLQKQKKEDARIVKARFLHAKGSPNGSPERLERPYCRWEGEPITMWRFFHDEVYDVPKGLVDEVNAMPAATKMSDLVDQTGQPMKMDQKGEKLYRFVPEGF